MTFYNIIQNNLHNLDWECLSENPNAIHLLEQNIDKIGWEQLSRNPKPLL
jgi:hypothetical protein